MHLRVRIHLSNPTALVHVCHGPRYTCPYIYNPIGCGLHDRLNPQRITG